MVQTIKRKGAVRDCGGDYLQYSGVKSASFCKKKLRLNIQKIADPWGFSAVLKAAQKTPKVITSILGASKYVCFRRVLKQRNRRNKYFRVLFAANRAREKARSYLERVYQRKREEAEARSKLRYGDLFIPYVPKELRVRDACQRITMYAKSKLCPV